MKKYKLSNGLTVLLTPQKETQAVAVLILIGVGSRYETEDIRGIAHFLEHMMFKGTEKRPNTQILANELDVVGAQYNAFTSKDHTGYYVKVSAEHLELAMDILSDMVWNSKLEEEEIKKEKGTILEELNMYEDHPQNKVDWLAEEIMYKKTHPLGWDEGGLKKTVKAINRQKMNKFKEDFYQPQNMVVSIAGNFSKNNAEKLLNKYFTNKETNKKQTKKFKKFVEYQKKPQIILEYKKTEQAHISMALVGPKYTDKDYLATVILANILGGSMSSRLFINIREKHGLCYWIHSSLSTYQDTGSLVLEAGLDKKRIKQAVTLILQELTNIKKQGITKEELKKAKENIKGSSILALENSSAIASWYGTQQLLIGKTKTPEQRICDIMKVTKEDVNRVAKNIFKTSKINLALIGPFKDEKEFKKLLKI